MAEHKCKSVHTKNNNKMQNSIQDKAPSAVSLQESSKKILNESNHGYDKYGQRPQGQENFRGTTVSRSRVLLKDVFSEKIRRWNETHIRSASPQRSCCNKAIPPDFPDGRSRLSAGQRLVSENRPPERVFSSTYSRGSQTVPQSDLQRRNITANGSTFWPVFGTADFLCGVKLGCGNPSFQRYPSTGVLRRLSTEPSGPFYSSHSGCGNAESARDFRMACQLSKVSFRAHSSARIPRHILEHSQKHNDITPEKSPQDKDTGISNRGHKFNMHIKTGTKPIGPSKLCKSDRPRRTSALPQNAAVFERVSGGASEGEESSTPDCSSGPKLVVKSSREQFQAVAPKRSHSLPNHRRSGCGVGRSTQRHVPVRKVDFSSGEMALKREGDVCSVWCNSRPTECIKRSPHPDTIGQQNTGGIYQKRRRHSISGPPEFNNQTPESDRAARVNTVSVLSARKFKRNRRPPVQRSSSTRVASITPGHGGHIQQMGRPRCRPIRIQGHSGRSKLCQSGLNRWVRNFLRRLQSNLGLSAGMGVSTTQPDPTGSGTPKSIQGDIHHNSSPMASVLLVPRSPSQGSGDPAADRGPKEDLDRSDNRTLPATSRQAISSGMESWGWSEQISHWGTAERELLEHSWRESTLSTYKAPIKRWLSWCNSHKIDPKMPTGNDVARFLAKLFLEDKLAYSTILLHKSAVSTFCAASAENFSKNFFVHQILKAISLAKPDTHRPPVFDIKLLFDWLQGTPLSDTLFDISRRTALILLLASGRRIHDLTLLNIAKGNLLEEPDKITLWPIFGSKTDSSTHRQSGWTLIKHPDEHICPVHHIKELLRLSIERRAQNNTMNLFISITGIVKPASRTNIANWIKTIFREVNIDAPPGRIRSAVASRGWLENRPVDEILKRGNWKSAQTFKKYYCREVQRTDSDNISCADLLFSNFASV